MYEYDGPHDETVAYLNRIKTCPNTKLYFKLRPDIPVAVQLGQYGLPSDDPDLHIVTDHMAILDQTDVVVGTYSTMLYDYVMLGKPVGLLETSLDFSHAMVHNGLTRFVSHEGICQQLHDIADLDYETRLAQFNKLTHADTSLHQQLARLLDTDPN